VATVLRSFSVLLLHPTQECQCGALSADDFLVHDTLEPRHDHQDSTRRTGPDGAVKDESVEYIVRSSILKLLREDESVTADSSPQRVTATSLGTPVNDIWAFRSKTVGSPLRFKASSKGSS
jgi:hypothetical protein